MYGCRKYRLYRYTYYLQFSEMDNSDTRNYSRGSTDRQIDMKGNNGSEKSQKKDLFNKKMDNPNKVKPVSVRYVASVEFIVDVPVIQKEASVEENTTISRYGRKISKSRALMKKNFVYSVF